MRSDTPYDSTHFMSTTEEVRVSNEPLYFKWLFCDVRFRLILPWFQRVKKLIDVKLVLFNEGRHY